MMTHSNGMPFVADADAVEIQRANLPDRFVEALLYCIESVYDECGKNPNLARMSYDHWTDEITYYFKLGPFERELIEPFKDVDEIWIVMGAQARETAS